MHEPIKLLGARTHPVSCYTLDELSASLAEQAPPAVTVDSTVGAAAKLHPSLFGYRPSAHRTRHAPPLTTACLLAPFACYGSYIEFLLRLILTNR